MIDVGTLPDRYHFAQSALHRTGLPTPDWHPMPARHRRRVQCPAVDTGWATLHLQELKRLRRDPRFRAEASAILRRLRPAQAIDIPTHPGGPSASAAARIARAA